MNAIEEPTPSLGRVFKEALAAEDIHWLRWESINGKAAAVYSFTVPRQKSKLALDVCCFPKINQAGIATFSTASTAPVLAPGASGGGATGNCAIRQTAEAFSAPDSERESDRPGKKCCGDGEEKGVRRTDEQQGSDGGVIGERKTHLPVENGNQPGRVANRERPVELILGAQGDESFRRDLGIEAHLVEIVAGGERGEEKRENGYTDDQQEGVQEAAEEIAHHD